MDSRVVRRPAVAGAFYAATENKLRGQIEWCFRHPIGPGEVPAVGASSTREIVGLISPHAGYAYSGPIAAHCFSALAADGKPDVVVMIGPNHRGMGADVAVGHAAAWQTPLGETALDIETASAIVSATRFTQLDEIAHAMEHSLEVQLPFLQFLFGTGFKIVPIVVAAQEQFVSVELGRSIASVLAGANAVVIASTDLSHYELQHVANRKDRIAIERMVQMDTEDLLEVIWRQGISMCGPGPVVAAITACKLMGANHARLLRYATSGDVSGDFGHVVGYASVKVERLSSPL